MDDDLALVITLELVFNLRFWITKQDIFWLCPSFSRVDPLQVYLAGLLYFYVFLLLPCCFFRSKYPAHCSAVGNMSLPPKTPLVVMLHINSLICLALFSLSATPIVPSYIRQSCQLWIAFRFFGGRQCIQY